MSKGREKITVDKLYEMGFKKAIDKGNIYYEFVQDKFFLVPDYELWTYGWEYGLKVIGTLSQITYLDELKEVMTFNK